MNDPRLAQRRARSTRFCRPRPGARAQAKDGSEGYSAADIEVLEGLEPVRRRPGMYIGGTDEKALHHLFAEVIDNSMDEAVAGHATWIEVESRRRRLPDRHRQRPRHSGRPASEIPEEVGARSHHDARCMRAESSTPRSTRPRAACTASASRSSTRCRTASRSRSRATASSTASAFRAAFRRASWRSSARCTTGAAPRVRFHPDPEIFGKGAAFEPTRLFRMTRSKAYLFGGVEIRWTCDPSLIKEKDPTPAKAVFHFPGGLKDYLAASLGDESRSRARSSPARPTSRAATARSNGRSPGTAATASSTPTATPSPPPRAAPTRRACATCSDARPAAPMPSSPATSAPRSSPPTT